MNPVLLFFCIIIFAFLGFVKKHFFVFFSYSIYIYAFAVWRIVHPDDWFNIKLCKLSYFIFICVHILYSTMKLYVYTLYLYIRISRAKYNIIYGNI